MKPITCENCGVFTHLLYKILEFKSNKILNVCYKCTDSIRISNLNWEGRAKETEIQQEIVNLKSIGKRRSIREEAEKRLYGKVKENKREVISEKDKEIIFNKFGNECAICSGKEGLHIHHKDHNPSNNRLDNLILLCGVCHKKVHMKVR